MFCSSDAGQMKRIHVSSDDMSTDTLRSFQFLLLYFDFHSSCSSFDGVRTINNNHFLILKKHMNWFWWWSVIPVLNWFCGV